MKIFPLENILRTACGPCAIGGPCETLSRPAVLDILWLAITRAERRREAEGVHQGNGVGFDMVICGRGEANSAHPLLRSSSFKKSLCDGCYSTPESTRPPRFCYVIHCCVRRQPRWEEPDFTTWTISGSFSSVEVFHLVLFDFLDACPPLMEL